MYMPTGDIFHYITAFLTQLNTAPFYLCGDVLNKLKNLH